MRFLFQTERQNMIPTGVKSEVQYIHEIFFLAETPDQNDDLGSHF